MKFVITSGEPAGIGPDICIKAISNPKLKNILNQNQITVVGNNEVFFERAKVLEVNFEQFCEKIKFIDLPISEKVVAGELSILNQQYVLSQIDLAIDKCLNQNYAAMITAPIQKSAIISAGYTNFSGHTEYLAKKTDSDLTVMMLTSEKIKIVPLTTHIPISKLLDNINQEKIIHTLQIIENEFINRYGIDQPIIAVLGINPHTGENGKIGDEEIKIISPAIEKFAAIAKAKVIGPLSADTAFLEQTRKNVDVYLGMYHDQVLPVFKTLTFGHGVNTTLGLPFIRTSVDHGTALNLAASNLADEQGLISAIKHANYLANTQKENAKKLSTSSNRN